MARTPPRERTSGGIAAGRLPDRALPIGDSLAAGGEQATAPRAGSAAAVSWLRGVQNADGGFGPAPGDASSPAMTGWVALGLEAAGSTRSTSSSPDPITYLRRDLGRDQHHRRHRAHDPGSRGAGLDPRGFGGQTWSGACGRGAAGRLLAGQVNPTAFSIMALEAAAPTRATAARRPGCATHQSRTAAGASPPGRQRAGQHRRRAAGAGGLGQQGRTRRGADSCAGSSARVAASL